MSVPDEGYSRNSLYTLIEISMFCYVHSVDTSAGGLLVPEGIIRFVGGVSGFALFISF